MTKLYTYGEIPSSETIADARESAWRMLAGCSKTLKLPHVKIRWFTPVDGVLGKAYPYLNTWTHESENLQGLFAYAAPNEIRVRAFMSPEATARTVAHELYHLQQYLTEVGAWIAPDNLVQHQEEWAEGFEDWALANIDLNDQKTYMDYLSGKDFSAERPEAKETAALLAKAKNAIKSVGEELKEISQEILALAGDTRAINTPDGLAKLRELCGKRDQIGARWDILADVYNDYAPAGKRIEQLRQAENVKR